MRLKNKPKSLIAQLFFQRWRQLKNNLTFKLSLSNIFIIIEMRQISIDPTFQLVIDTLISHVDIHDIHSSSNFSHLCIFLLDDIPNCIYRKCKNHAGKELCSQSKTNLVIIQRRYIAYS